MIRGWCPDAWHPMAAGDGLLMRVKPHLGRMSATQAVALCEAALTHGSGLIDLTRRANLQIRGVSEAQWPALLECLCTLSLVDRDGEREGRRNILVAPEWQAGDDTVRIANELRDRLTEFPQLPGKVGFVIDAGEVSAVACEAGDFRVERGCDGTLVLRADGRAEGVRLTIGREVDALLALARWFVDSGGVQAKRMVRHGAPLPVWAMGDTRPASSPASLAPGEGRGHVAYGLPFGRIEARTLLALMQRLGVTGLRLTPWRVLLVEGASLLDVPGLLTDPADPLLRVDACPGAPTCPQASVETRDLARQLAPVVRGRLHVSGCAKGCASPLPADVTVTGRSGRYDLAFGARADAEPLYRGLDSAEILARLGAS
ncbi:Precorrin-3B synthase [Novosphingobium resinovorum]|uniref:Precorrin-3B synthase n=1 Tax=Novosphingobium resinovorum TaxID=158500 RepID=A0A031JAU8_9SPHN|nr:Precorrin-3B synthase [Novosphingobium resinovorum]